MGVYENFETIKDALGYENLSTEEIIAKEYLSEISIALINKKMEEAHSVLCHFPIGYTYDENKTSYYRIALSEQFQVLKEYPAETSILDFIALETENIVAYRKNMSKNITTMIGQKASAPDADGIIRFDFTDVTKAAVNSTLAALHNDNFFLFLVNCCFLQYVTELFVYNFYPFVALKHYKKILGDAFYYDEDTDILMLEEDGGLYDIAEFINYGIRMTTAFLDYQKDLLQSDFDILLMKDKLFAEYDTLQNANLYHLRAQHITCQRNVHPLRLQRIHIFRDTLTLPIYIHIR